MVIDPTTIASIAHLARLSLSDDEVQLASGKISAIMGLIDEMQSVDTNGVEPLAHPLDAVQRLRSDEITEINQREELQANAPAVEKGLFLVPRVIE